MNRESIIEKFVEQAKRNRMIESEINILKESLNKISDFLKENEKQLKTAAPDVSGFIIDFYKSISERIKDIYIKEGCLYVGESNLGEVCGKDGIDGKDGENGKDGKDGIDGIDGLDGLNGKDGKNGKDGRDGKDGKDGVSPVITVDEKNIYVNGKVLIALEKLKGKDGKNGKDVNNYRTLYEMAQEYGFSESEEKFISVMENLNNFEFDDFPEKDSKHLLTGGSIYDAIGHWEQICVTKATTEEVTEIVITSEEYPLIEKAVKIYAECYIPKAAETTAGYWYINDMYGVRLSQVTQSGYAGTTTLNVEYMCDGLYKCSETAGGNDSGQNKTLYNVPSARNFGFPVKKISLRGTPTTVITFPVGTIMRVWAYIK